MSLHDVAGDLQRAVQRLESQWDHTRAMWTDDKSRGFAKRFQVPLVEGAHGTVRALRRLSDVFDAARDGLKDGY